MAETAAEKKAREAEEKALEQTAALPQEDRAALAGSTPAEAQVPAEQPPAVEENLANGTPSSTPAVLVEEVPDDGESEWMYMKHSQIEGRAAGPIQRQAFNDLWSHKGWKAAAKPAEEIPV